MARYERDYGREYDWTARPDASGGMRSDGWGGTNDWTRFAGEEGWYGEGYEGMPGFGYDFDLRAGMPGQAWGRGWEPSFRSGRGRRQIADYDAGYGYGYRFGRPGFSRRDYGYPGRDSGYAQGWEEPPRRGWGWHPGPTFSRWGGPIRALDIMTEDPFTLTPDATIADAARVMRDIDVGIIPVVDNDENLRLRGVITDRDIVVRALADGKDAKTRVDSCMSTDVRTVNRNDSIYDVMRVMRQERVRRVPVTDREGRLVGIIAQADLAVDYARTDLEREIEVEETIERISEPGEPRRQATIAAAPQQSRENAGEEAKAGRKKSATRKSR